jgi:DNA-binding GntR family transcriptional regulator
MRPDKKEERMPAAENRANKEEIYDTLKNRMLTLELTPREKVSENAVAAERNVSRTIVREVFSRLIEEGWLEALPQSGTYVTPIHMPYVRQCAAAYIMIADRLIAGACRKEFTANDEKLLLRMHAQTKRTASTRERLERDIAMRRMLAQICSREFADDFMNSMNCDFLRACWLSYETFSICDAGYPMTQIESMDVSKRMLVDYLQMRDPVAANMLVQNYYDSILQQSERVMEIHPDYFSGDDRS